MKRFSIGFSDEEYQKLEEIKLWYEQQVGVRVSRCAIIKRLLFESWKDTFLNGQLTPSKTVETASK